MKHVFRQVGSPILSTVRRKYSCWKLFKFHPFNGRLENHVGCRQCLGDFLGQNGGPFRPDDGDWDGPIQALFKLIENFFNGIEPPLFLILTHFRPKLRQLLLKQSNLGSVDAFALNNFQGSA